MSDQNADGDDTRWLVTNLAVVRERIARAAQSAGRNEHDVTLVAVTKTRPLELVQAAYLAGVRDFGENRPEEGRDKADRVQHWLATHAERGEPAQWHMIGHLQRRKADDVLAYFDIMHSLDSLALAQRLDRLAGPDRAPLPVLLECNVSGEPSKNGFRVAGWRDDNALRRDFFDVVAGLLALPHLRIGGLMTMAPIVEVAELARPVFAALRALRDSLADEFPVVGWQHLSMGMTDDFEVAIEEGATMVRVGRAIFDPSA